MTQNKDNITGPYNVSPFNLFQNEKLLNYNKTLAHKLGRVSNAFVTV
jgi:hypothetical protein